MEQKPIGSSGVTITPIGLGGGNWGREVDEETSWRAMDYALEKGITFFDTGELYGGRESWLGRQRSRGTDDQREATLEANSSEKIIGRWMRDRGCRDQLTISTKLGTGGSAENVKKALTRSLERLGTDYVDILKVHFYDAKTPVAETVQAMSEEVDAGRARVIGFSNHTAAQLQETLDASKARGVRGYEIAQIPYNLLKREVEPEMFPLCQREGIAISSYSPIGAGFLTGKYTPDFSQIPFNSRFSITPGHADEYLTEDNFRVLDLLREKSAEVGISIIRLAMAWAMTHPAVTAVLIGARTPEHIDNALAAHETGMDPGMRAEMASWTDESNIRKS